MSKLPNASRLELTRPARNGDVARGPADELLRVIGRRWKIILAAAIVMGALGYVLTLTQASRYRATSISAVVPLVDSMPAPDRIRGVVELSQRMLIATIEALAMTPAVQNAAMAAAPHAPAGTIVIHAVALPNTSLLRIDVDAANGATAAAVANRIPQILDQQAQSMFRFYSMRVVSPASTADLVFPRTVRTVVVATILGLLLGVSIAWVTEKMRRPLSER